MSTASLLRWIALVAGAELAVRGHLAAHVGMCHAGAALFAIALAALAWPTRARRAGVVTAAALLAIAAVDAAAGAFAAPAEPSRASLHDRGASSPFEPAPPSADPAPGSPAILVLAGRDAHAQPALSAASLAAALRERARCAPPIAAMLAPDVRGPLGDPRALAAAIAQRHPALVLVIAAPELLDDVVVEAPALDFPPPEPIGPRGSRLGCAIETRMVEWRRERAWQRAVGAQVELDARTSPVIARYREIVLAARRADAEVALVIPPLAIAPDAPADRIRAAEADVPGARRWLLASRAHARGLRVLAGSYAMPAIDPRPELDGDAFADLARLSAAGREQLAQAVADALADRLKRIAPGCGAGSNGAG